MAVLDRPRVPVSEFSALRQGVAPRASPGGVARHLELDAGGVMAWVLVSLGGQFETAFAVSLKYSAGFSRLCHAFVRGLRRHQLRAADAGTAGPAGRDGLRDLDRDRCGGPRGGKGDLVQEPSNGRADSFDPAHRADSVAWSRSTLLLGRRRPSAALKAAFAQRDDVRGAAALSPRRRTPRASGREPTSPPRSAPTDCPKQARCRATSPPSSGAFGARFWTGDGLGTRPAVRPVPDEWLKFSAHLRTHLHKVRPAADRV